MDSQVLAEYMEYFIHIFFSAITDLFSNCYPLFGIFSITIICFVIGMINKFINLGRRN